MSDFNQENDIIFYDYNVDKNTSIQRDLYVLRQSAMGKKP